MRPSPVGEELVKNLNKIGVPSWHFSLFDFFPSLSAISLSQNINELYTSNVILVFSKNAIYYTNLYFKKNNLQWPSHVKYYAIGKSTANVLYRYIKKKIIFPKKRENSENLLRILYKKVSKKDKIVLLQGENGRKLIEINLKKSGFKVCIVECYKRVLKKINGTIESKKWRLYQINSLVVTSSEILYQLTTIISETDQIEWLFKCKIFVVGRRLSKIAQKLGWKDIVVCRYADNEHLFKIIQNQFLNH